MKPVLFDLAIVVGGYLLVFIGLGSVGASHPGVIAILVSLALATWRLHAAGESWQGMGMQAPARKARTAGAVLALYVLVMLGILLIVEPLSRMFAWKPLDLSVYASLPDNPVRLLVLLTIVWTSAAFGEELLFRGFLLRKVEILAGYSRVTSAAAVIAQAALFAVAHLYLGARGIATAGLVGIIFGTWYTLRGRNLWPLILAHGAIDTVGITAIYLGLMPA